MHPPASRRGLRHSRDPARDLQGLSLSLAEGWAGSCRPTGPTWRRRRLGERRRGFLARDPPGRTRSVRAFGTTPPDCRNLPDLASRAHHGCRRHSRCRSSLPGLAAGWRGAPGRRGPRRDPARWTSGRNAALALARKAGASAGARFPALEARSFRVSCGGVSRSVGQLTAFRRVAERGRNPRVSLRHACGDS